MEGQNKYRVIVSDRATRMLVSHAAFLAQASPEAAERLTEAFEKTANSLAHMPQRCHGSQARISPETPIGLFCLKNAICSSFRSKTTSSTLIIWWIAGRTTAG